MTSNERTVNFGILFSLAGASIFMIASFWEMRKSLISAESYFKSQIFVLITCALFLLAYVLNSFASSQEASDPDDIVCHRCALGFKEMETVVWSSDGICHVACFDHKV